MKIAKRVISVFMVVVVLASVMSIGAEAASVKVKKLSLGYMVPTNSKGTKTIETVKLYGDYDYINFYIKCKKDNSYFVYEIYSDKKMTKLVEGDIVACDKGSYTFTPKIKLKGTYKSKTYYMATYAAKIKSNGNVEIDKSSMREIKVVVKRSADFDDKVVVLKEVKNTTKGVYIKWGKLSGTKKYQIMRRSITGTKWKTVGTVSSSKVSFTDTSVKNKNVNYIYSVRAINKKGTKSRYLYSGLVSLFAKTPTLKSVTVIADNVVEFKWNSTSSKAKYTVMRKEGDGKWKTLKTGCTSTTYKDTTAKSGKKYTYTVKAVISTDYGSATSSYYSNSSSAITYLSAPALGNAVAVDNGVQVSWNSVSGAKGYSVYRKTIGVSKNWVFVEKVGATKTSYVDTTATHDGAYVYTIRSEADNNKGSYKNAGVEYVQLNKPVINVEPTSSNTIKISWEEVPYTTEYQVYRRMVGGEWELLTALDNEHGYYSYNLAEYGDFEFSVRAVRNNKIFSEFSDAVAYHNEPMVLASSVAFSDGIEIGWSDHGYESYNIYRRLSTESIGEEVLIGSITGNCFKDTTAEPDVAYSYSVIGVIEGVEYKARVKVIASGISTTLAIPKIPAMRVVDNILYDSMYYDDIYAYNYKYGYWAGIGTQCEKSYYEEFLQDGKLKLAFADRTPTNIKTPIDNTIIEKEWFDDKIEFTTKVKNNEIYITCVSLSPKIEYLFIGSEDLGVGGHYYLEGANTVTAVFDLPKNRTIETLGIEIDAYTFENDRSTTKAKVKIK